MATSVPSLFRVTGSHFVSHTNDRGVCFVHKWDRQDGEDSAERSDNLGGISFTLQIKSRLRTDEYIFIPDCLHNETEASAKLESVTAIWRSLTLRKRDQ